MCLPDVVTGEGDGRAGSPNRVVWRDGQSVTGGQLVVFDRPRRAVLKWCQPFPLNRGRLRVTGSAEYRRTADGTEVAVTLFAATENGRGFRIKEELYTRRLTNMFETMGRMLELRLARARLLDERLGGGADH